MNLSFLDKADREHFQRLFLISGCGDLLEPKETSRLWSTLTRKEFLEGCRNLNRIDIAAASKGKSQADLSACVQEAAKHSNGQVSRSHPGVEPLLVLEARAVRGG